MGYSSAHDVELVFFDPSAIAAGDQKVMAQLTKAQSGDNTYVQRLCFCCPSPLGYHTTKHPSMLTVCCPRGKSNRDLTDQLFGGLLKMLLFVGAEQKFTVPTLHGLLLNNWYNCNCPFWPHRGG